MLTAAAAAEFVGMAVVVSFLDVVGFSFFYYFSEVKQEQN
jgi:hypothetical protein